MFGCFRCTATDDGTIKATSMAKSEHVAYASTPRSDGQGHIRRRFVDGYDQALYMSQVVASFKRPLRSLCTLIRTCAPISYETAMAGRKTRMEIK